MKILKELVHVMTKRKAIHIEVVDQRLLSDQKSKLSQFYHGLAKGQFEDDQEAALYLYGATNTDEKYRQLKSRFRKRLLNTFFFLDPQPPANLNYDYALLNCERQWALVQILNYYRARTAAIKLARSVLKTALNFHFTHLVIQSARLLRQYAAEENEPKAFHQYQQYLEEYLPKQTGEIQAEEIFQTVSRQYFRTVRKSREPDRSHDELIAHCDQLLLLSEKHDAPSINFQMYLAWIMRYELQNDYGAMLEVCEQAATYLADHPQFCTPEEQTSIQIKIISAYLHTQDFPNGKTAIEKGFQHLNSHSKYWLIFLEYYLLLALHTQHYLSAFAIFNQAATHPHFNKLTEEEAEKWLAFDAFLQYFAETKQLRSTLSEKRERPRFHLQTFLNTQYAHPQKKINLTVQLTALQILFLLERRNLRLITEKIKYLRKYALPYLKRNANERPLYFVQLLQQLIRADFQTNALIDQPGSLQKLLATPFAYKGRGAELEVIPYEQLWQQILDSLG